MATNDWSPRSFRTASPLTNRVLLPRMGSSSPRCRCRCRYCYSTSTTRLSQCSTEESSSDTNTNTNTNSSIKNTLEAKLDWNDRIGIQDRYTLEEKGWEVRVDWRSTPYGAGVFSREDSVIEAGTILRRGIIGLNLKEFTSIDDIHQFCTTAGTIVETEARGESESVGYRAKLGYVKDYLWGFNKEADERGYDTNTNANTIDKNGSISSGSSISPDDDSDTDDDKRFFGMWVPGNGLNHNETPNTVYRPTKDGIDLVALVDIKVDDELFDDYRRHGTSSPWLKEFADIHNVTLNFADCNDFV